MQDNGSDVKKIRMMGWPVTTLVLLLAGAGVMVRAQAPGAAPTAGGAVSNPEQTSKADQKKTADSAAKADEAQEALAVPTHAGVLIDRVVAVVNGDVVLESDVEEERRMSVFQPISSPEGMATREKAIERLVNRRLLLQQAQLQPQHAVTEADIDGLINAGA